MIRRPPSNSFDSAYGRGWRRENSLLVHAPQGSFCYGFYPRSGRPSGEGTRYRITVIGPGVTPDVSMTVPGLHDYDPNNPSDVAYEQQQNAVLDSILSTDKICRHH